MSDDFDGCYRRCRTQGKHTLMYGACAEADKPEPTVSMSKVTEGPDGYPCITYDQYTVHTLAELIEPALRDAGELPSYRDRARAAAHAIVHRNDKETEAQE